jgi:N-acetylmuramoyl-L-alanine amidase
MVPMMGETIMYDYYYERVLLVLVLAVTLFYSWKACCIPKHPTPTNIEEINHHCGGLKPTVQVGNCMFYCNTFPDITVHHTVNNDIEEHIFTLHNALLANEKSIKKAEQINTTVIEPYKLSIQAIKNGTKNDVRLCISYPKGAYSVQHKVWEEQKNRNKKGVVFYIFNQSVIDALRKNNEPMLRTTSLSKHPPRIFIDSGHGGSDMGAVGPCGAREKDICLRIGLDLASILHNEGYDVLVSRMTDCDVPLDERTSRANSAHASIFISIHANASCSVNSHGIETYYLLPTFFDGIGKTRSSFDTYSDKRVMQSKQLAEYVQKSVCCEGCRFQKEAVDRGVKSTVSQVLVGTTMPSILIELGFITNPQEAALLTLRSYQYSLARGIAHGVKTFWNPL